MITWLASDQFWAVVATAAVVLVTTVSARRWPGRWLGWELKVLAVLLLIAEASWWISLAQWRPWSPAYGLPLHFCDTAALITAAALWWRQRWMVELTWFWGMVGCLQGLLTPDLQQHFPNWWYFQYYLVHALPVVAAILLVIGLRLIPRRGAVVRAYLITALYTILIGGIDFLTGGNYMYLRQPPNIHSLLNFMGPWPWYILSTTLLALLLFWLFDLPFQKRPHLWPGRKG
ncbi:MAG: TIGR02206 family membrane protein [Candidatus Dormibacteraceae bacterium]